MGLKASIFVEPNIRRLLADQMIGNTMADLQRKGWFPSKDFVKKCLSYNRDPVVNMLT